MINSRTCPPKADYDAILEFSNKWIGGAFQPRNVGADLCVGPTCPEPRWPSGSKGQSEDRLGQMVAVAFVGRAGSPPYFLFWYLDFGFHLAFELCYLSLVSGTYIVSSPLPIFCRGLIVGVGFIRPAPPSQAGQADEVDSRRMRLEYLKKCLTISISCNRYKDTNYSILIRRNP